MRLKFRGESNDFRNNHQTTSALASVSWKVDSGSTEFETTTNYVEIQPLCIRFCGVRKRPSEKVQVA